MRPLLLLLLLVLFFFHISRRAVIHGSDSAESAEREIALWFSREELIDWESPTKALIYE